MDVRIRLLVRIIEENGGTFRLTPEIGSLLGLGAFATVGTAHAQTLIGSSSAGWQTWTLGDNNTILSDLNDNGAPY